MGGQSTAGFSVQAGTDATGALSGSEYVLGRAGHTDEVADAGGLLEGVDASAGPGCVLGLSEEVSDLAHEVVHWLARAAPCAGASADATHAEVDHLMRGPAASAGAVGRVFEAGCMEVEGRGVGERFAASGTSPAWHESRTVSAHFTTRSASR